jgi:hypothetical protein
MMITTEDFIIELFYNIDNKMTYVNKHPQSSLYPSEIVTLAVLLAIKGVGSRAFYRWLRRDWLSLFPKLPHRTRLLRLFKAHRHWSRMFMADPTVLGVIDSYGIEFIHPIRQGRSEKQIGRKGKSNHRWIVGGELCLLLNQLGTVVDWGCSTANVHDSVFLYLVDRVKDKMIVLGDSHFHTKSADPQNLKICERGRWNVRMLVETVLSMLTNICKFKKLRHRVWEYFEARLGFMMAAFNILVQWRGLEADENGFVHLSIAEFSL